MKQGATSAIPRITADFITATSAIAELAVAPLRQKCEVIQRIADRGLQVDDLTIRELVQLAQETTR